jgi:pimeloyl-ACP methyl ester carboxylesterase
MTKTIELSAGRLEYEDSGDRGPTIVFLHGLLMDSTLWDPVVAELSIGHRCIVPTLPFGAHSHPMRADGDLALPTIAGLVAELIDRLQLDDVTVVGSDTGGAVVQLLIGEDRPRIGRIALVSCDAFDNFPPGLTGKALVLAGKLAPALFGVFMQQLRIRAVRRLPIAFGWLTKRGDAVTRGWLSPILTNAAIRRDAVRVLRGIAAEPDLLERAAASLARFERPALVIWAAEDRVMPPAHGRRLSELLPRARLVEVDDSYTLISLDQPGTLALLLREFGAERAAAAPAGGAAG